MQANVPSGESVLCLVTSMPVLGPGNMWEITNDAERVLSFLSVHQATVCNTWFNI